MFKFCINLLRIILWVGMSVELIFSSVETISTIITVTAKMKTISCLGIRSQTSFVYQPKSKMNILIKEFLITASYRSSLAIFKSGKSCTIFSEFFCDHCNNLKQFQKHRCISSCSGLPR